ncbi:hypothetical protein LUZ60_010607 [Juncus effusus]|nr:hypothetical protein LUZ60_010607 [Juncus effusus]
MSSYSKSVASIFLMMLFFAFCQADWLSSQKGEIKGRPKIDCGIKCQERCTLSSRPHLCKRACGTCCVRCHCVPPGTSGNYEKCPCYYNMTTHGGKRKCP